MKLVILFFLTTFGTIVKSESKYCQLTCGSKSKPISHTVCDRKDVQCGPHERCGDEFKVVKFNNTMREFILNLHNHLRNNVAMGNETRGKQPTAANMQVMSYNTELEYIAQCWANDCQEKPLKHDKCRRTEKLHYVGQNLAAFGSTSSQFNKKSIIESLIMGWYNEVKVFDNKWIRDFRGINRVVGHYTQMIWADTKEVGCAVSYYTSKSNTRKWHYLLLACNYGPGGNIGGSQIYKIGKPASECKNKKNKDYKALCGESTKINEFTNTGTSNNIARFNIGINIIIYLLNLILTYSIKLIYN